LENLLSPPLAASGSKSLRLGDEGIKEEEIFRFSNDH
jgi:hypothetical protein